MRNFVDRKWENSLGNDFSNVYISISTKNLKVNWWMIDKADVWFALELELCAIYFIMMSIKHLVLGLNRTWIFKSDNTSRTCSCSIRSELHNSSWLHCCNNSWIFDVSVTMSNVFPLISMMFNFILFSSIFCLILIDRVWHAEHFIVFPLFSISFEWQFGQERFCSIGPNDVILPITIVPYGIGRGVEQLIWPISSINSKLWDQMNNLLYDSVVD